MAPPIFPSFPGLAWPVARSGPIYSTVIQTAISGKRTAYVSRVVPRWHWELPFEFLRTQEIQTLRGFFGSCYGAAFPFAFTDAEDNAASNQTFGVGDGTTTTFQLVRTYGGLTEPVYLPTGTPAVYVDGAQKTAGTDYTIDSVGRVVFTVAPSVGALLTWAGSFNWLCAFDDDQVESRAFMSGLWSIDKLSFTSVVP